MSFLCQWTTVLLRESTCCILQMRRAGKGQKARLMVSLLQLRLTAKQRGAGHPRPSRQGAEEGSSM